MPMHKNFYVQVQVYIAICFYGWLTHYTCSSLDVLKHWDFTFFSASNHPCACRIRRVHFKYCSPVLWYFWRTLSHWHWHQQNIYYDVQTTYTQMYFEDKWDISHLKVCFMIVGGNWRICRKPYKHGGNNASLGKERGNQGHKNKKAAWLFSVHSLTTHFFLSSLEVVISYGLMHIVCLSPVHKALPAP